MSAQSVCGAVVSRISLIMRGFFREDDRPEWRPKAFEKTLRAWCYRNSSWGYSLVGFLMVLFNRRLASVDPGLWWSPLGVALFFQGGLSYMADVVSFAKKSRWQTADMGLATMLMLIVGPVLMYRMLRGRFQCPGHWNSTWSIGVVGAMFSKYKTARESRKLEPRCDVIIFWHTCWHALPFLGSVLVADMAARAGYA